MRQKTYSDIKPEKKFDIQNVENGKCTVLFFDNIQEETQKFSNLENEEVTEKKVYSYDVYSIEVAYRENLSERIEADIEKWLNDVKEKDYNEVAAEVRAQRDKLLQETDSEMCLDRMGLEMPEGTSFTAWITFLKTMANAITGQMSQYRQALRDIPQQEGFPYNIVWPTKETKEE